MKKMINEVTLAGRLFSAKLDTYTVKKEGLNFGTEFIRGDIFIATDDACVNVVPVSYVYEVPLTKSKKENTKYTMLKKIMDTKPTVEEVGKDNAMILQVTNATIVTEDWYSTKQDKAGSTVKVQSGFLKELTAMPTDPAKINEFCTDVVFTGVKENEVDEERGIKEPSVTLSGYVFNFRGEVSPVQFTLRDEQGMEYMLGLGISKREPMFTKIWGTVLNSTVQVPKVEESAWGDAPIVTYTEKTTREWLVTRMRAGYEFDTDDTITKEEMAKCMQDREIHLAEVRKAAEDYAASQAGGAGPMVTGGGPAVAVKKDDGYTF
jgi:hypothetical protein